MVLSHQLTTEERMAASLVVRNDLVANYLLERLDVKEEAIEGGTTVRWVALEKQQGK